MLDEQNTSYCDKNIENKEDCLNKLNEEILNELQSEGEVFISNAIVNKKYCLRACIVNFRTSKKDIHEIIEIIIRVGRRLHLSLSLNQKT